MPDFGDGSPREEYGQADPNAPSVANGQISPAQWAEYQAKRRRDMILGLLSVAGMTTGLGVAGQALGGAGVAGSAATGGGEAVGAAYPGAGLFGAPAGTAGGTGAGVGASVATGVGGGAGAGAGSAAGNLFAGMSGRDLAALGLGLGGTIGGAMSNPPNTNPSSATSDPQMAELLSLMSGRLKKSEPLHDSVLSMANGLLPMQYQKGGGGMG